LPVGLGGVKTTKVDIITIIVAWLIA